MTTPTVSRYLEGFGRPGGVLILLDFPSQLNWSRRQVVWGEEEQLLLSTLRAAGIRDGDFYTAFAIPFKPVDKKPSAEELLLARKWLVGKIHALKPTKILCLGQWARAVLRDEPVVNVDKIRGLGEWVSIPDMGQLYMLTTIPIYFMTGERGNPDRFRDFGNDVFKFANSSGPKPEIVFDLRIVDDPLTLIRELTFLHTAPAVVVDVETTGLDYRKDRIIAFGLGCYFPETDRSVSVVVTEEVLRFSGVADSLWRFLTGRTSQGSVRVVMHNAKFDLKFCRRYFGRDLDGIELDDTIMMSYLLDERPIHASPSPHGLKTLARSRYDVMNYALNWEQFYEQIQDPVKAPELWQQLYFYLGQDLAYTARLHRDLRQEMIDESDKLFQVYRDLLIPGLITLTEVEMTGAMVDRPYLEKLAESTQIELIALNDYVRDTLLKLGVEVGEINLNSPKQVKSIVYEKLGLQIDGAEGTDKDTMNEIAHALDKLGAQNQRGVIQAILKYREQSKMLSTYIRGLLEQADENDRVHGEFNLHGTSTGRLSCSNPNLQNIPTVAGPTIRRAFIARPGFCFMESDFSQLELRIAAHLSGDEIMKRAYIDHRDIHKEVAAAAFGIPYEDVTKDQRYAAKYIDFGILYGRSPQSLAEAPELVDYDWTIDDAQGFIDRFLGQFKELRKWIEKINTFAITNQYIETQTGRRRRWPLMTYKVRNSMMRQSVNTPIQSLASDCTLSTLIKIHELLKHHNYKSRIVATVHDSICLEVALDELLAVSTLVYETMMTAHPVKLTVPVDVDVEVGDSWGDLTSVEEYAIQKGLILTPSPI